MKADARRIAAALDKPPADIRLYLLYGPDEASAAELAARLARAMGAEAERVDLDGATLKNDPARLADEAASLSLFGGARHIRVAGVGDESLAALEALLSAERVGNPVVALAPSVKTTARIVKLALDSPLALVHACYAPSGAEAAKLAAAIARDHGLRATAGAAARLAEAAGGDRAVITREIEKLALYLDADEGRPADLDEVALDAVGADMGNSEIARAVTAVVDGDPAALGVELGRLATAGASPIAWLRQLNRRLLTLAEMRVDLDRGNAVDAVMKRHRIHFREEASTARALRRWTGPAIADAMARLREAERATMAPGNAGDVLAGQATLAVTRRIARR